jgi:pyruvate,water dikinase
MIALGLPVPAGFVVSAPALGPHVGGELPPALRAAIARAAERLGGRLAVRSSLVAEDDAAASFAGQLETVLDVGAGSEVLDAVRAVAASALAPSVRQYAADRLAGRAGGMAVVVQRMVAARAAGVAFSADPMTGQRRVVIEAVAGSGDRLVRGRATPDRFVVDARGVLATQARAELDEASLPTAAVLQLAELVRAAADQLGGPHDVEWAWDGDRLHLLQARPITALAGKHVFSARLVGDMCPGVIKPLLWSTKPRSMAQNVVGRLFRELLGHDGFDYARLLRRIHSRAYMDATAMGVQLAGIGLPANFFESIARDERASRRPPLTPRLLARLPRIVAVLIRHSRAADGLEVMLERHEAEVAALRVADPDALDLPALLERVAALLEAHGDTQWCIFASATNMMVRNRLLERMVRRHAPDVRPTDLLRGLRGMKSLDPNAALRRLAASCNDLGAPERALLLGGDDRAIRERLAASVAGRRLAAGVDGLLDRFGYLSANGSDFTEPTWAEQPAPVWTALGRLLAAAPRGDGADPARLREQARAAVRARLGPLRRALFDRLLAGTQRYLALRERVSLLLTEDAFELRRLFLAVGGQLVRLHRLERPDDVFYLYRDELEALARGEHRGADARALVANRRAELAADEAITPPETVCGEAAAAGVTAADTAGREYLVGIAASSGLARGRARVVRNPGAVPSLLCPEEILVVPFTDVGWTPLLATVGGVVAEGGGQLSHTSIVAREYGLPAVVGVDGATTVIRDGQEVTVDGTAGRVWLGAGGGGAT